MKSLLMIAVVGLLGYLSYQRLLVPAEVTNPVYIEMRLVLGLGPRQIESAVFGKTTDDADCLLRAERVRANLEQNCPFCVSKSVQCKPDLEERYIRFFNNEPATATYLSVNRSIPGERDVRVIFWGVTHKEGDMICESMKKVFAKIHNGPIECVRGIES